MRAIKFRVWDQENNVMFGPVPIEHADVIFNWTKKRMIPLQYSGLKDKNGIEIYDADILIGEWSEQGDTHKHTQTLISEVCFRAGGFVWHGYPMSEFKTEYDNDILKEYRWTSGGYNNIPTLYYMVSNFRVIGNIYENPELLDGEGK